MDNERVSYEEAVEAICNWSKAVYEFSDDDVETIYANGRPIYMVREQTRNALTTYDLEYGYRVPVGNFTSIDDVAWLLANGDITLQDARIWCVNTNHSLVDMEQEENKLLRAKTETLENAKDTKEMYANVLKAMAKYNGVDESVGSIRYGQTETTTIPAWYEKKRSWPYRLVAFLNELIDAILNDIDIMGDFL